jgi:hypothetical protein
MLGSGLCKVYESIWAMIMVIIDQNIYQIYGVQEIILKSEEDTYTVP